MKTDTLDNLSNETLMLVVLNDWERTKTSTDSEAEYKDTMLAALRITLNERDIPKPTVKLVPLTFEPKDPKAYDDRLGMAEISSLVSGKGMPYQKKVIVPAESRCEKCRTNIPQGRKFCRFCLSKKAKTTSDFYYHNLRRQRKELLNDLH